MRITVGGILLGVGVVASAAYFALDTSRFSSAIQKIEGAAGGAKSLVGLFRSGESARTATPPEAYSPPPPFPAGNVENSTAAVPVSNTEPNIASTSVQAVPVAPQAVSLAKVATPLPIVKATPPPVSKNYYPVKKRRKKGFISIKTGSQSYTNLTPTPTAVPAVPTAAAVVAPQTRILPKKTYVRPAPKPVVQRVVRKPPLKAAVAVTKTVPAAPKKELMGSYVSLELITGRAVQGILEGKTATHYVLNVPGLGPLEYPIENVKSVQPAQ